MDGSGELVVGDYRSCRRNSRGALPGLTATMALALMLPFTFTMGPEAALILLGAYRYRSDLRRIHFRHSDQYAGHSLFHRHHFRRFSFDPKRAGGASLGYRGFQLGGWGRVGGNLPSLLVPVIGRSGFKFWPTGIFLGGCLRTHGDCNPFLRFHCQGIRPVELSDCC